MYTCMIIVQTCTTKHSTISVVVVVTVVAGLRYNIVH